MDTFKPSKTGDSGRTTMARNKVSKTSKQIEFVGKMDTLHAHMGELRDMMGDHYVPMHPIVDWLIAEIYNVSSYLHTDEEKFKLTNLDAMLQMLTFKQHAQFFTSNFGDTVLSKMNVVRVVVREAELAYWRLCESALGAPYPESVGTYLNRMSSVMYAMICHCVDAGYGKLTYATAVVPADCA